MLKLNTILKPNSISGWCLKKAQTWSLEAFVAVMIFMLALVLFYSLTSTGDNTDSLQKDAELLTKSVGAQAYFEDGILDDDDVEILKELNCDQLKELFQTKKDLCIYMTDESGTLVTYGQDKPLTFGCEGLSIGVDKDGKPSACGKSKEAEG